ncbi:NlpC/P60 family protein, partial [Prescottella equi]
AAAAAAAAEAARRAAADQASRERASQVADSERPHTQIDDDGEWSAPAQSAPKPMAPSVTGAGAIETVIDRGMSQLGLPYAWGGGNANGPTLGIRDGGVADSYGDFNKVGFDCSGLMIYAFAGIGISLPHYTGYQYTAGTQVPSSQMRRGDMIFWGPGASQHVALYLGDGQMLEAPQSGSTVRVSPVRWDGMTPYAVRMVS